MAGPRRGRYRGISAIPAISACASPIEVAWPLAARVGISGHHTAQKFVAEFLRTILEKTPTAARPEPARNSRQGRLVFPAPLPVFSESCRNTSQRRVWYCNCPPASGGRLSFSAAIALGRRAGEAPRASDTCFRGQFAAAQADGRRRQSGEFLRSGAGRLAARGEPPQS